MCNMNLNSHDNIAELWLCEVTLRGFICVDAQCSAVIFSSYFHRSFDLRSGVFYVIPGSGPAELHGSKKLRPNAIAGEHTYSQQKEGNHCENHVLVYYKKSDIINTIFRLYLRVIDLMLILHQELKYLRRVDVT